MGWSDSIAMLDLSRVKSLIEFQVVFALTTYQSFLADRRFIVKKRSHRHTINCIKGRIKGKRYEYLRGALPLKDLKSIFLMLSIIRSLPRMENFH